MASRMADSQRLVKRCENAGWQVERSSDGYRVYCPDGYIQGIHLTYSDTDSLVHATKALELHGLKQAEQANRTLGAKLRREKMAADKEAAEKKALELQRKNANSTLRQKAAGPYRTEIEECDLNWMIAPHPAPWIRWMYVTPQAAKKILQDHNGDNRALSVKTIERYKAVILSNQWQLTHQGIAFDTRGILQDGQHRLDALAQLGDDDSDLTLPFAVFVGMPEENFKAIDEGRLRNASQMFAKAGVHNPAQTITALRAISALRSGNPAEYNRSGRLAIAAAFAELDKDADIINGAVAYGERQYQKVRLVTAGIFAAAYYVIGSANGFDNPYVTAFFEGFVQNRKYNTNFVLPDDDPRAVLRMRIETQKRLARAARKHIPPFEQVGWFVRSWNNMVEGKHPSYIKPYGPSEGPRVLVCKPDRGATPRALNGEVDL